MSFQNLLAEQQQHMVVSFADWSSTRVYQTLDAGSTDRDAIRALVENPDVHGVIISQRLVEWQSYNEAAFERRDGRLAFTVSLPRAGDVLTNFQSSQECKLVFNEVESDAAGTDVVLVAAQYTDVKLRFYFDTVPNTFSATYDVLFLQPDSRQELASSGVDTSTHEYRNGVVSTR